MTITIGMVIFSVVLGLGFTGSLTLVAYSPAWIEQYEYSQLGTDERMNYVLNEMSCQTVMLSSELHETEEIIPLVFHDYDGDGKVDEKTRANTLEECWDHCQVLIEGYEPEPDHYFIHVPFGEDGYMSFEGLDELVQECRRQ